MGKMKDCAGGKLGKVQGMISDEVREELVQGLTDIL